MPRSSIWTIFLASWKDETSVYSASWQIKAYPAYQQIVNLGEDAIPRLLDKLSCLGPS